MLYNKNNPANFWTDMIRDKRIVKTRTSIKNAFMTLMLDKELNKITVSDIAEKAQINRSTFYLHYADAADVMTDIENEIGDKISECIGNYDPTNIYTSNYALFTNLTTALDGMETVKKFILFSTGSKYMIRRLKDIFTERARAAFSHVENFRNDPAVEYRLTFIASGVIDTYIKWALAGEGKIPLEELSRTVSDITERIVSKWQNNE